MSEQKTVEMVVVDGVRYRPDDAPKKVSKEPEAKEAPAPKNKARSADSK